MHLGFIVDVVIDGFDIGILFSQLDLEFLIANSASLLLRTNTTASTSEKNLGHSLPFAPALATANSYLRVLIDVIAYDF